MTDATSSDTLNLALTPTVIQRSAVSIEALNTIDIKAGTGINFSGPINFGDQANLDILTKLDLSNIQLSGKITLNDAIIGGTFNTQFQSSLFNGYGQSIVDNQSSIVKADIVSDIYGRVYGDFLGFQRSTGALSGDFLGSVYVNTNSNDYLDFNMYDNINRDNDSVPNFFNQLNNGYMKIETFSSNIYGKNIQNPSFDELKPLRLNDDLANDIIYGNVDTDITIIVNNMNVNCTVSVNNTTGIENYNFNGTLTDNSIYPIITSNCIFDNINSINIGKGTITDGYVNITTGNVISGNVFIDFDKFYKLKGNINDNKLNISVDTNKLSIKNIYLQFPIFNFEFNYGYQISDNPIYYELKMDNAIQYLNKLNIYYSQGIVNITNNFYSFITLPDSSLYHVDDISRYNYITTGRNRTGGNETLRVYQCTWSYVLTSAFKNKVIPKIDDVNNTYLNSIPDDVNGMFINGGFGSLGEPLPYYDKNNYWIIGGLNKVNFTSDAPVFLQFVVKYNAFLRYADKVHITLVESIVDYSSINDVKTFIIQGNNPSYLIGEILPQKTVGWQTLECNIGVLNPAKYYFIIIEYQKNNHEFNYYYESENEGDYIAIKEMYIKQIPYNLNLINTSINTITKTITGQLNITTPSNTLLPFFKNYNLISNYSKIEKYLINFLPSVNNISLSYYNNIATLFIPYQGIRYNNKTGLYGSLTLNNEPTKQNKAYNFKGDMLYMNSNYYKYTWNVTNRWSKILSIDATNTIEKIDKFLNNRFLIIQNSGMENLTPGDASTNLISFFTVRSKFVKKGQVSFYYVMNTQTLSDYFVFDYSMDDGETFTSTLNTSGDRQDKWNYSSFIFEKGDYIFRWYYKKSLLSTIKVDYVIVSNILINDLDIAIDSQNKSTGINILGNVLVKDYYQRDVNLTLPIYNGVYGFRDNEIFMGISSNIGNLVNNQNAYRYDLSNNYYADNVIYSIFTERINTYIRIQNQGILKIDNTITQIDKSNKCWRTETDYENRKVYLYAGNKHSPSLINSLFDGETAYLIVGPLLYTEFTTEYYIKFNLQCQTEKDYDIFFINYYDFTSPQNGIDIINNYFEKNPYKNVIYNHSGKLITPLPVSCYQEKIPSNLFRYYLLTYKKDLSNSYQLDYVQIDSLNFEFYKKAFSNDGRFFGSLNNSRNGESIIDIYGQGTFKSIQTEKLIIKRKESEFDSGIINRYDNYIESDLYVAGDIIANFASRDGKNIFSSNVLIKGVVEMEKSMYIAQNLVVNGTITSAREVNNNFITSPLFSLHKLQEWPADDYSAGFHIEDTTGLIGFLKTTTQGDAFAFKVPNRAANVMIYPDTEVQSNVLLDFHPVSQRIRRGNLIITNFISANIRNNSGTNFIYGNVIIDKDMELLGNVNLSGLLNANIKNNSGKTSLYGNMYVEQSITIDKDLIVNGNIISTSAISSVNNDFLVKGNLSLNKDVTVEGLLSSNIKNLSGRNHIFGNTDIDKNLTVFGNISGNIKKLDGNTFLFGNMFITNDLQIYDNTIIGKNLKVDNDVNISNDANINNNLNVNANTALNGELVVQGNISGNIHSLDDNTYLFGNMYVTDNLEINNNLDVKNDLFIVNNATIGNELVVSGNTYLDNCAIIENDCIINNDLSVVNNSTFNTVDILSDTFILGNIDLPNDTSIISINNIPVLTNTTLGETVLYSSIQQLGNLTNLTVLGNTELNNLNTSGVITINNNTGSNTFNDGALVVNGGVGIVENLNIGSNLSVMGNISTNKDVLLSGNLFINNNIVLDNSSLGNTILYSNLVKVGTLDKLDILGNVVFNSTTNALNYNNAPFLVKGGMAVSKDLFVSSNIISKTIDTLTGETLTIANSRASIINIASGTTAQTVNIGRSNTQPKEIYIGTGLAPSKIFIGSDFASVVIKGNTQYTNATNLTVEDKNVYLNKNAVGPATSYLAGIYIRDNNNDNAGYMITNDVSTGLLMKAPNNNGIISLQALNNGTTEQNTVVLNYNTSALNTINTLVKRDGLAVNLGTINSVNEGDALNLQHIHEFGHSVINWTRGVNKNKYAYIGKPQINSNIFEINTEYEVGSQIKITPGVYGILLNSDVNINGNSILSAQSDYIIGNSRVLSVNTLGNTVIHSNLTTIGNLTNLNVLGNINFNGALYQNGLPFKGSQWEMDEFNSMYYTGGFVGINNNNPQTEFDVDGNINISDLSYYSIGENIVLNKNTLGNNVIYSNLNTVGNLVSLKVLGNTQIDKELYVSGNIRVINDINLNTGSVYRINNTQILSETTLADCVINSNLNTVGNLQSLKVIGPAELMDEVYISGNVNVASDVNLNAGSVYRIDNVEILSETTLADCVINSNLNKVGDLESVTVIGEATFHDEVYVSGNVNVIGDVKLNAGSVYRIDDVEILSETTLAQSVIYSNLNKVGHLESVTVIGEAEFQDEVYISGNLNLNTGSVYRIDNIEILSETTLGESIIFSNLNTVGNLENLHVLGNIHTNTIDTPEINGTLNIATQNASIINIGSLGGTVNILSNLNYIETNNLEILDNTITLNKGAIGSETARGSGIHIRDNDIDDQGFIAVNNVGTGWLLKAPENSTILDLQINNFSNGIVKCNNSQITSSVLTVSEIENLQTILDSKSNNSGGTINGNINVSGINITSGNVIKIAGATILSNTSIGSSVIYSNLNTIGNLESLTVVGAAEFQDEVYVSGSVNVASNVNVNAGSVYRIDDVEILSNTTLAKCVINSNLNTVGNLESVTVVGAATFQDEVYVSGSVNVASNVNLNAGSVYRIDDIEILSNTTLANSVIHSNLNTVGNLESLNVVGVAEFQDEVYISGGVNVASNINVNAGSVYRIDDIEILSNTTLANSVIHSNLNTVGNLQSLNVIGNINFNGSLNQNGTLFKGSMWETNINNTNIYYSAGLVGIKNNNPEHALDIGGNVNINELSNYFIGGNTVINKNSIGHTVIYSNLNTLGNLESVTVIGTSTFQDEVYVSGNLNVAIDVNLNAGSVYRIDDVEILSETTLADCVIYSNLNTVGNLESVTVLGVAEFQDEVYVSGNINLNAGSAFLIHDVEILSETTLADCVIYSNLNTVGNLENVTVLGVAEFQDEVYVSGNINLNPGSAYRIDNVEILTETTLADCVIYSNLNTVGNLEYLNVLGDIHGNTLDTNLPNGTLNIGTDNASILNVGTSMNVNTINIGTGLATTTINIGGTNGIVNLLANVNYIQSNNLEIFDSTLTLNKGSTGDGTARGSGIHIRDNDIDNQGFITVNSLGTGWVFKAPENEIVLDLQINNFTNGILKCNNSQITSSLLTISEIQNLQTILDSKSNNSGGTINGNLTVFGINLASGNVIKIGGLTVLSNTTLGTEVIYSNLNTVGNLESVTVVGAAEFQDEVYISGNVNVASDVNLNAGSVYRIHDVEILSNTTLGTEVIYSNLSTVGNLESVTVVGAAEFQDEVYISGNVNVASDVNLNPGSVYRIHDVEILSNTTLAECVVYSNLNTVGNLESVTVVGAAEFQDEVYISGNVNVASDVNLNAGSVYRIHNVEILSNTTLAECVVYSNLNTVGNLETLKVLGNVDMDKELYLSGNAYINGHLNVNSNSYLKGNVVLPSATFYQIEKWTQNSENLNIHILPAQNGYGQLLSPVSLSNDGNIIAIGMPLDKNNKGCVRLYLNDTNGWAQIGSDIDGEFIGDKFGSCVSLSGDGTIVAIGAGYNTGNTSTPDDNKGGSTRVFRNINNEWIQYGNDIVGDMAGDVNWDMLQHHVKLSRDGSTLVVGAPYDNNNTGRVRVYRIVNDLWTQLGNDINGEQTTGYYKDYYGMFVSLSANGLTLAIGMKTLRSYGPARVFTYDSNNNLWNTTANIDGDFIDDPNGAGYIVNLSNDGSILAISDNKYNTQRGRVSIYQNINNAWIQMGEHIIGDIRDTYIGYSISLSSDGTIISIGTGPNDNNGTGGMVNVYRYINNRWVRIGASIFGGTTGWTSQIGYSVSLSSNGEILAIGAVSGKVNVYKLENSGSNTSLSVQGTTYLENLKVVRDIIVDKGLSVLGSVNVASNINVNSGSVYRINNVEIISNTTIGNSVIHSNLNTIGNLVSLNVIGNINFNGSLNQNGTLFKGSMWETNINNTNIYYSAGLVGIKNNNPQHELDIGGNVNINELSNYFIGGNSVINKNSIGNTIIYSNLNTVGNLENLTVIGAVEFQDELYISGNVNVASDVNLNAGSVYRIDDVEILSETTLADCVIYSNLNTVGNLENLTVIGAIYSNILDTYDVNATLNIGTDNASILNIGTSMNVDTINIGTGLASTTINIGGTNGIVNILSNVNYIQSNILEVSDNTITLNKGSAGNGTGRGSGIYIRDNDIDNQGFITVNSLGTGWVLKAPEHSTVLDIQINNFSNGILKCDNSQITSSILTIAEIQNLQAELDSKSNNSGGSINGNINVFGINITSGNIITIGNAQILSNIALGLGVIYSNLNTLGNLENLKVIGNVDIDKELVVFGNVDVTHDVNIHAGSVYRISGIEILSDTTLAECVVYSNLNTVGNLENLKVLGNVDIDKELVVSGNVDVTNDINIHAGSVYRISGIEILSDTTLAECVVYSNLNTVGNLENLKVLGNVNIDKELFVSGNVDVTHDINIHAGSVYRINGTQILSNISLAECVVHSNLNTVGNLENLKVLGNVDIDKELVVSGNVNVTNDVNLNAGSVYRINGTQILSNTTLADTVIYSNLNTVGNLENLKVIGNVNIDGNLHMNKSIFVNGVEVYFSPWVMTNSNLYYNSGSVALGKNTFSPNYVLDINGNVRATSYNSISDYRIKAEVETINNNSKLHEINPVSYFNKISNRKQYGFIAHDLATVFPELVDGEKDGKDHQSIDYISMIALLIKEVQSLKKEIDYLKK